LLVGGDNVLSNSGGIPDLFDLLLTLHKIPRRKIEWEKPSPRILRRHIYVGEKPPVLLIAISDSYSSGSTIVVSGATCLHPQPFTIAGAVVFLALDTTSPLSPIHRQACCTLANLVDGNKKMRPG
jgi:hypothetical protein